MDLDFAAARHVQVWVSLGEFEGGVEVFGLDDAVAGDLSLLGGAVGGNADSAGKWGAEVDHAVADPAGPGVPLAMTASMSSGSGGAASAGVIGAWYMNTYLVMMFLPLVGACKWLWWCWRPSDERNPSGVGRESVDGTRILGGVHLVGQRGTAAAGATASATTRR